MYGHVRVQATCTVHVLHVHCIYKLYLLLLASITVCTCRHQLTIHTPLICIQCIISHSVYKEALVQYTV